MPACQTSQRRACRLILLHRSTCRYKSSRADDEALRMRMRELAVARPRYGYRRLHILLRRGGWGVNLKKVLRIYREEGLLLRTRRRRKTAAQAGAPLQAHIEVNERWGLDFMSDQLVNGQHFRVPNVIDQLSRECLASEARARFSAMDVTEILELLIQRCGSPASMKVDHGSEFTSRHFDAWAHHHQIQLEFIRPGRPMENGLIESFNGRLRDECLNASWFLRLDEAQATLDSWRRDYNQERPHTALGGLAPIAYVARILAEAEN